MKNNKTLILVIILIVGGILLYSYFNKPQEDTGLKVKITYFDKDGNIVGNDRAFKVPSMAVIEEDVATRQLSGGIPATATTAVFEITTINDGNVPLNITISNIMFSGDFID